MVRVSVTGSRGSPGCSATSAARGRLLRRHFRCLLTCVSPLSFALHVTARWCHLPSRSTKLGILRVALKCE